MPTITDNARDGRSQILDLGDVEIVMSIRAWAAVIGVGYSTAKKIMREGDGPVKVRLSQHRVGVTASAHKAWLRSREA
jgi:predicted DNA-binding transcriptional regulator AlpA